MILSSRHLPMLFCLALLVASSTFTGQPTNQTNQSPQITNLVAQLVKAETPQQIQTLLADNKNLITVELAEAISNSSAIDPLSTNANLPKVELFNQMLLGVSQQVDNKKAAAIAISQLGLIYRKLGQFDLSISYFNDSLSRLQKIGDLKWVNQVRRYLARTYYERNDFSAQMDHSLRAFDLAIQDKDAYGIALANFNLGVAHEELELYEQADGFYKKGYAISETVTYLPPKADLPGLINDLIRREASNCFALGDYRCSIEKYSGLVAKARQANSPVQQVIALNLLANAYHEAGDLEKASQACHESLAISEANKFKLPLIQTYRVLGYIHSDRNDHSRAVEFIEQARALAEATKNKAIEGVYLSEGIICHAAGRHQQARAAYDKAIKLIEERQAIAPVNVESGPAVIRYQYPPFARMIALLASQGQKLEALNYSERAKGRYLFDLLSNANTNGQFAEPADLNKQQKLIDQILALEIQLAAAKFPTPSDNARLETLQAQMLQAKESLKSVESTIKTSTMKIAEQRPEKLNLTESDLLALLPDDKTALAQFTVGKTQTFLFVATKPANRLDLQIYPINLGRLQLQSRVEDFRQLIENLNQTTDLDLAARSLHDDLFSQAQEQLKSVNSLIVVPDASLWELPFQALKTSDNRYLIQKHAISYAPSFNLLKRFSQSPKKVSAQSTAKLLAFGNPALNQSQTQASTDGLMNESLSSLPEAEKQVEQIRRLYGLQKSRTFIRGQATEERFKLLAPNYSIIHLAAHGLYNDLEPMRSRIVLSQIGNKPGVDGYLEASEIAKIKLNADLVILSACETGRGRVRGGEGIIGLPWAIFAAGCPTTVVSQWSVDSKSTADLMVSLHRQLNLNGKPASKSEALRQAAISLINSPNKDFRHPFFWAGFIVLGKAD